MITGPVFRSMFNRMKTQQKIYLCFHYSNFVAGSAQVTDLDGRVNKWHQEEFSSTFCGKGSLPIANQVVYHSALHYVGDVRGKTLLDVACGEGDFCRLVKLNGASRVMGVDISSTLLENSRKQGGNCEYRYGNAYDLGLIDQFDFVTANRLILYAETSADLKAMCRGFYENLKPGGRFVGVAFNCFEEDPTWGNKIAHFGFEKLVPLPQIAEAKRVMLEGKKLETGQPASEYILYYFDPPVYEQAFKQAGFRKFSFKPVLIDKSVPQPEGFWDIIEEKPHFLCYVADK